MTELDALMAQKREIEAKIRELRTDGVVMTDGAALVKTRSKQYPNGAWRIRLLPREESISGWRRAQFRGYAVNVVVGSTDRAEVIAQLPLVIADLQELQEKLQNEADNL